MKESLRQTDQGSFSVPNTVAAERRARRGGKRALAAIAHSMALAGYHILLDKDHFCDSGSDCFNTIYAEKIKKRNVQSLEKPGFSVSLS